MRIRRVFKKARKQGWAVGQFNFATLEQYRAIVGAAREMKAPVILGTSEGEAGFVGLEQAVALKKAARKKGARVVLHLDHGKSIDIIKKAVRAGYDSVHFDGSLLSFDENLRLTKKVVRWSRRRNVFVEGELGVMKGGSDVKKAPVVAEEEMTDPDQAERFARETGVDSLAVCVGNVHGSYEKMPGLDLERLREIGKRVESFLVFHGSSGFSKEVLGLVVKSGVQKININTSLRKVWRRELEKSMNDSDSVKPYKILASAEKEMRKKVEDYIHIFNKSK